MLVWKHLAQILAEKSVQGRYTRNDALAIGKAIALEILHLLLGVLPRQSRSV